MLPAIESCYVCNKVCSYRIFHSVSFSLRFIWYFTWVKQLFHLGENGCSSKWNRLFTWVKKQMQMGKNKPYDALLQGSNSNYGTGIRTTDIRQAEFYSGEWKTVLGEFRMFFHIILLIYREILRVIRNGWCVSLFYFFQQLPERSECPLFPAPGEVQGIGSDDL